MRAFLAVVILAALVGCATESKLSQLRIGMTRAEVVAQMGQPRHTRATANEEYLIYQLAVRGEGFREFFVRIVDGKVNAWGKPGDFSTTNVRILNESK